MEKSIIEEIYLKLKKNQIFIFNIYNIFNKKKMNKIHKFGVLIQIYL